MALQHAPWSTNGERTNLFNKRVYNLTGLDRRGRIWKSSPRGRGVGGAFQTVAEAWRGHLLATRSEVHKERTWDIVGRALPPYIGKCPISEIKASELLQALRVSEERGHIETAQRPSRWSGNRQAKRPDLNHVWT